MFSISTAALQILIARKHRKMKQLSPYCIISISLKTTTREKEIAPVFLSTKNPRRIKEKKKTQHNNKAGNKPTIVSIYYSQMASSCFGALWARLQSQITAFWKGHSLARYVHSPAPLTFAYSLHSAMLTLLAHSICGLAHSLRSLPCWAVEIYEYVFTL